jgi:sulfite reductase alpha subunit-like flavoprotein
MPRETQRVEITISFHFFVCRTKMVVRVIYGSQTGNSEAIAKQILEGLNERGIETTMNAMADVDKVRHPSPQKIKNNQIKK